MHRRNFIAASAAAAAGFGPQFSLPAYAAENGVTDGDIVLGHTGILSGPLGVLGQGGDGRGRTGLQCGQCAGRAVGPQDPGGFARR